MGGPIKKKLKKKLNFPTTNIKSHYSPLYLNEFHQKISAVFADFCTFIDADKTHFYICHVTNRVLLACILGSRVRWLPTFTLNLVLLKHYSKIKIRKKNFKYTMFFFRIDGVRMSRAPLWKCPYSMCKI